MKNFDLTQYIINLLGSVLAYYGWIDQVMDAFQLLSRDSRSYIRSHHQLALQNIVRVSRWHAIQNYSFK